MPLQHHTSGALNVAIEAKVADQLLPAGEAGLPATKLGEASGVHPAKLSECCCSAPEREAKAEYTTGSLSQPKSFASSPTCKS